MLTLWQRDQKRTVVLGFVYLQNARNGKRLGQALFQIVSRLGFTKQGFVPLILISYSPHSNLTL
jgi:hypothetical protein